MNTQQSLSGSVKHFLVVILLFLVGVNLANGASITWSAASNVVADSDVSTVGTLVRAVNLTQSGNALDVDVTLNGVTFVHSPSAGTTTTLTNGDVLVAVDSSRRGAFSGFGGADSAPFNGLSAAYQSLLSSGYYNDGDYTNAAATGRYTFTLSSLTVGKTYQLQVWVNDYRLSNLGQNNPDLFTTFSDGVHSVDLQHNVGNVLGGIGQYAIGTFVADATNQVVTITGGNAPLVDVDTVSCTALFNAYQLREVAVSATNRPVFTGASIVGTNILLLGTNGPANGAYEMLRSSDLNAPVDSDTWDSIGNKAFDASGNFSFLSVLPAGGGLNFYAVHVLSTGAVIAPGISNQPQNLAVAVGETAVFSVSATGTAPLNYRWYYNTNTLLTSGSDATLTLANCQLSNGGKYSVTITNLGGVTNSIYATLTVTNSTMPPGILTPPADVTVTAGQTANFSVVASGALPLRYQWYFNTNTVLAGQTNSSLALNNVQAGQAGKYSVLVTNVYGSTTSPSAMLTVGGGGTGPDFSLMGWATVDGTTTGGAGGTTSVVSTASALISAAQSSSPATVLVSGSINLNGSTVNIRSHKSLIGVGTNATIIGHVALNGPGISNVVIRNLTLMNPTAGEDALTIQDSSHHVWVDHCNFAEAGDGELDITHGSDYITVSWCKFSYTNSANPHRLTSLVGHDDANGAEDAGHLRVTYHHNWWSTMALERMPRVRFGQVHLFNNYYNSLNNNYCVGLGCSSQILLESCCFDKVNNPWKNYSSSCTQGLIHWNSDNVFINVSQPTWAPNSTVFTPPYAYALDAGSSVKTNVTTYGGAGRGPFAP